jgi:hypothetical protein
MNFKNQKERKIIIFCCRRQNDGVAIGIRLIGLGAVAGSREVSRFGVLARFCACASARSTAELSGEARQNGDHEKLLAKVAMQIL